MDLSCAASLLSSKSCRCSVALSPKYSFTGSKTGLRSFVCTNQGGNTNRKPTETINSHLKEYSGRLNLHQAKSPIPPATKFNTTPTIGPTGIQIKPPQESSSR